MAQALKTNGETSKENSETTSIAMQKFDDSQMSVTVLCHPRCSTCKKALAWLDDHCVEYVWRNIIDEHPSYEELSAWFALAGLPIKKFFNTSGMAYCEQDVKNKLSSMSDDDAMRLLSTDGMLVKRPFVVVADKRSGEVVRVLIGFTVPQWESFFS